MGPISSYKPMYYHSKLDFSSADDNKIKDKESMPDLEKGLLYGLLIGSVMGAAMINIEKKNETKELINEIYKEYDYDDNLRLKIQDINNDKMPEIILRKNDGVDCVYDFGKGKVYIKDGKNIREKVR